MGQARRNGGGEGSRGEPGPLREREHELAAAEALIAAAADGRGGALILRGHAGIGKSRLLTAVVEAAAAHGLRALTARASSLERGFPFGVVLQLFAPAVASEEDRAAVFAGAAQLARPLLEGHEVKLDAPTDQASLFALMHGLHWTTSNLADRRPLLLAIDDEHWADLPSLRFLVYLAQRLAELPVALVATLRPFEPDADTEVTPQLLAHENVEVLDIPPLSAAAVGAMVEDTFAAAVDAQFAAACAEVTAGNPFLVRELLTAIRAAGIRPDAASAERLYELGPDTLTRRIVVRLTRLEDSAAALARAVAVLGDGASLREAAAMAEIPVDVASAAADALAAADILIAGEPLSFVHPLVRSSIYSDLGAGRRGHEHLRAARLIDADGRAPEAVASHLLEAAATGDAWVVDVLAAAAGRARARGAASSAAAYLARAIDEPAPPERRGPLLRELGEAAAAAGLPDAADHARAALELADAPDETARSALALGRILYARGEMKDAVDVFALGIAALDGSHPELRLQLEAEQGIIALIPSMRMPVHAIEERVRALMARPTGELSLPERQYLAMVALAMGFKGDPAAEALAVAKHAYGDGALLAQETSDGTAVYAVTGVLARTDALDFNERVLSDAVADARRRGSVMAFATASYSRAWSRLDAGMLVEAVADAEQAIDVRRYGWEQFLAVTYGVLALCYLERDDLEQAKRVIAEVDEITWRGHPTWLGFVQARGQVRVAEGRYEEALADFDEWAAAVQDTNPAMYAAWRSCSALALAALGRRAEAVERAREEVELTRRFGARRSYGVALRALGLVERGAEGIEHLRAAVAVLEESPGRLERCRALVDLGAALRREGERVEGREVLARGLALAEECGALALARRASEELAVAGGRGARRAATGVESLTPSERRVAGMAAGGMTNREVAQALFVTPKAVQWHLGNAYRKLGVHSREELAKVLGGDANPGGGS